MNLELQRIFGRMPTMVDLFRSTTIRTLARYFSGGAEEGMAQPQHRERIEIQQHAGLRSRQARRRVPTS